MAKTIQPPSQDPEQGTVQEVEALQKQTNAMPPVDAQVAAVVSQGPVAPGAQQAAPAQQGFTVKNRYMLLPPTVNFPQPGKTPVEQQYDAGLMLDVISRNSPALKVAADELLGR